jgi:hypothetical protein
MNSRDKGLIAAAVALVLVVIGACVVVWKHQPPDVTTGHRPSASGPNLDDRLAQADLRNALVAAKVLYTDSASYRDAVPGNAHKGLTDIEPALTYVRGAPTGTDIGVEVISSQRWAAARMSASGACFYISDDTAKGTRYGQTPVGQQCKKPSIKMARAKGWV